MSKGIFRAMTLVFSIISFLVGIVNLFITIPITAAFLSRNGDILERATYVASEINRLLSGDGWLQRTAYVLHQRLISWTQGAEWGYFALILVSWTLFLMMFVYGRRLMQGIECSWSALTHWVSNRPAVKKTPSAATLPPLERPQGAR